MSVERHEEDVRALGPLGVFYTNELPAADLRFREALEQLERNFAEPARHVRMSDLVKLCCATTGVAFETLPTPNAESVALRTKQHAAQRKEDTASKAAAAAAAASQEGEMDAGFDDAMEDVELS